MLAYCIRCSSEEKTLFGYGAHQAASAGAKADSCRVNIYTYRAAHTPK